MKIYCVEWKNLPSYVDDFTLFTSAKKANSFWERIIETVKSYGEEDTTLFLSVFLSNEEGTGEMEGLWLADYSNLDQKVDMHKTLWEEFLEQCKNS